MTGQRRGPRRWRPPWLWKTWLSNDLLVRAPQYRKMSLATILTFVLIGQACLITVNNVPGWPWYKGVASGVLGSFVALVGLASWRRQVAYRCGWINGRTAMLRSLREARYRGVPLDQVEQAEDEWDRAMMRWGPPGRARSERRRSERRAIRVGGGDGTGWRGWGVRGAGWLGFRLAAGQRSPGSPEESGGGGGEGDDRQAT